MYRLNICTWIMYAYCTFHKQSHQALTNYLLSFKRVQLTRVTSNQNIDPFLNSHHVTGPSGKLGIHFKLIENCSIFDDADARLDVVGHQQLLFVVNSSQKRHVVLLLLPFRRQHSEPLERRDRRIGAHTKQLVPITVVEVHDVVALQQEAKVVALEFFNVFARSFRRFRAELPDANARWFALVTHEVPIDEHAAARVRSRQSLLDLPVILAHVEHATFGVRVGAARHYHLLRGGKRDIVHVTESRVAD